MNLLKSSNLHFLVMFCYINLVDHITCFNYLIHISDIILNLN